MGWCVGDVVHLHNMRMKANQNTTLLILTYCRLTPPSKTATAKTATANCASRLFLMSARTPSVHPPLQVCAGRG